MADPVRQRQPTYNSFQLPQLKQWKKYFSNVCRNLRSLAYVLDAYISDTAHLCIVTDSRYIMVAANSIVQKEIQIFINRKQQLVRPLKPPGKKKTTTSRVSTSDQWKANTSNVLHRIFRRKQQLTPIKKKKIGRKKWHEPDKKLKKTKTLLKYIRQELKYRRRHKPVWLYRQEKRSPFEYRQKKIIGRKRDRSKVKHALRAKTKYEPNRHERKLLCPYKHTTTYGSHTKSGNISVTRIGNTAQWQTELLLSQYFCFPAAPIVPTRFLTSNNLKILLRYSSQWVYIYAIPINHRNRPSNKYLIKTCSTLNNSQSGFFVSQPPPPTAPARQAKVKKQKPSTKRGETQATILVESRHHDSLASQSARPKNQKTNTSKGKLKKNR